MWSSWVFTIVRLAAWRKLPVVRFILAKILLPKKSVFTTEMPIFVTAESSHYSFSQEGVRHRTEVGFLLRSQLPQVRFSAFTIFFFWRHWWPSYGSHDQVYTKVIKWKIPIQEKVKLLKLQCILLRASLLRIFITASWALPATDYITKRNFVTQVNSIQK